MVKLAFLQSLIYKAGTVLTASLVAVSGLWSAREITITPEIAALPKVEIIQEEKMPDIRQELKEFIQQISQAEPIKQLINQATSSEIKLKTQEQKTASAVSPLVLRNITPEQFLNKTKLVLKQRLDGTYWLEFQTNLSGIGDYKWEPSKQIIGAEKSIPQFNVSFNCEPTYNQVPPEIYSAFSFRIKTAYTCDLSLADAKGKTSQKQFNFTTGPGLLSVFKALGMLGQTLLRENTNTQGIVFTNTDDAPVTINEIISDVSLTAIDTTKPMAIRFSDDKEISLADYSLGGIPQDPTKAFSYIQPNVKLPFSFTIEPRSSRMMLIQALGIHKLYPGVNPYVGLVFNKVSTDRSDMALKTIFTTVFWTCTAKKLGAGYSTEVNPDDCAD